MVSSPLIEGCPVDSWDDALCRNFNPLVWGIILPGSGHQEAHHLALFFFLEIAKELTAGVKPFLVLLAVWAYFRIFGLRAREEVRFVLLPHSLLLCVHNVL